MGSGVSSLLSSLGSNLHIWDGWVLPDMQDTLSQAFPPTHPHSPQKQPPKSPSLALLKLPSCHGQCSAEFPALTTGPLVAGRLRHLLSEGIKRREIQPKEEGNAQEAPKPESRLFQDSLMCPKSPFVQLVHTSSSAFRRRLRSCSYPQISEVSEVYGAVWNSETAPQTEGSLCTI